MRITNALAGEDAEEQLYEMDFELSAANWSEFSVGEKQAEYFTGMIDSRNTRWLSPEPKILSYQHS